MRTSKRQERRSETMAGVRLTEFAFPPALRLLSLLDLQLWNVQGTFSEMFYILIMGAQGAYIYLSCPEEERSINITENTLVV